MGFHMGIQHRFVDTSVATIRTLKWFGTKMVSQMVFQMVFVFSDKGTFWTIEHFFWFNMHFCMSPKIFFCNGDKFTLFTFEHFDFAL